VIGVGTAFGRFHTKDSKSNVWSSGRGVCVPERKGTSCPSLVGNDDDCDTLEFGLWREPASTSKLADGELLLSVTVRLSTIAAAKLIWRCSQSRSRRLNNLAPHLQIDARSSDMFAELIRYEPYRRVQQGGTNKIGRAYRCGEVCELEPPVLLLDGPESEDFFALRAMALFSSRKTRSNSSG
jgi:hypothetical protein